MCRAHLIAVGRPDEHEVGRGADLLQRLHRLVRGAVLAQPDAAPTSERH